ncbi:MAG: A/G-specific adenine glycosylase [Planctomycetota bacterium]|nr:MAG: A/G-specific adenine glycosylase [Planctomycetota bacterium]
MPLNKISGFSKTLINWYLSSKRDLPWRLNNDSYRIWISEIMLQQTRVDAVIVYYENWMKKWPTLLKLSKATEDDVLNAWKGLGYYSRARNILKTAQIVVKENSGKLPEDIISLNKLPGIGRYTAGAIASIAYGKQEAIVDGNVSRVYARLLALEEVINDPKQQDFYYDIATSQLPGKQLSEFNQGLMELGALICTPQKPNCIECPVKKKCLAYKEDLVDKLPNRKKAAKSTKLVRLGLIIKKNKKFLLIKQNKKGLFYGLWEIPAIALKKEEFNEKTIADTISNELKLVGEIENKIYEVKHTFTKYRETILVYSFTPEKIPLKWQKSFFSLNEINDLPMGSAHKKIFNYMRKRK